MNGTMNKHVFNTYKLLKFTYGLTAVAAGLDKFMGIFANWGHYVSPQIAALLPISTSHLMYVVGIIEIIVGIFVLSNFTKIGAYIMAAWLFLISINLVLIGAYDIAIRDTVMGISAIGLAWLSDVVHG